MGHENNVILNEVKNLTASQCCYTARCVASLNMTMLVNVLTA